MNNSPLLCLPREIRDQIYRHVMLGIGPTCHKSSSCNPSIYIRDFRLNPSSASPKTNTPDVWAVTARDHPILYTCRQLCDEAFESFLFTNEFVQNISAPPLTTSACKFVALFVRSLGDKSHLVRKLGLGIEDPTEDVLEKLLDWMIMFKNCQKRLRPGALVLRVKFTRPTTTPPLFSPVGQTWTIAPKDENVMALEIHLCDEGKSWSIFDQAKELDRKARQRGTERVLKSCRDSGMKGIEEREKAWREERRLWHEETWTALHYKFECWMKIMDGLQPRKRLTEEG
ncbi:hypothetical protein D6C81_06914 [Aureobasidium pullulans]|nr:hypothetical protein D6C81_06914 [Aureobasidium pullulans]